MNNTHTDILRNSIRPEPPYGCKSHGDPAGMIHDTHDMIHVTHMIHDAHVTCDTYDKKNVLTKIVQHDTYDTHETYPHTSWSHFWGKFEKHTFVIYDI